MGETVDVRTTDRPVLVLYNAKVAVRSNAKQRYEGYSMTFRKTLYTSGMHLS